MNNNDQKFGSIMKRIDVWEQFLLERFPHEVAEFMEENPDMQEYTRFYRGRPITNNEERKPLRFEDILAGKHKK